MNDDAEVRSFPVVAFGCLLLAIVACCYLLLPVVVVLFAVSGTPASGNIARRPTSVPVLSRLGQSPTPGAGQVVDYPANPANGKQLFNTFQPAAGIACATCHRVDSEERLVGPGLLNVGKRAETRVAELSAVEYLRQSIVHPSAYVVEGYADIMPKNWGQVFSEKQIDDLIAYLLTLSAG